MKKESIGGIIVDEKLTFVRIFNLPDEPDWGGSALEEFCFYGQTVNFISENMDSSGKANLSVTLHDEDTELFGKAVKAITELHEDISVEVIEDVCLITVYGPHFKERCGLAATFFRALGLRGINILSISTSISSISAVIEEKYLKDATKALRAVFDVP
ncbi:MAG: ACT domain-containing protein [Candidatus Marinimicrobia bacterium]|nr:ACT domain-containing protein [Candidatus Neomarinimicrobiota bacterium]MCF7922699.1 ACT domain-containing protein [Candidatus Neomarinimicrobiota bacterium]